MSRTRIEPPVVTRTRRARAAVVHVTIPRSEMRTEMPRAIQEVLATVEEQGIGPAGPLFAHHLTRSAETFDFEVGVPVDAPLRPVGRVRAGELPGARVVRSAWCGPYEGLFAAWSELGE